MTQTSKAESLQEIDGAIDFHSAELNKITAKLDTLLPGASDARRLQLRLEFQHGYLAALRHVRYALAHPEWNLSKARQEFAG